MFIISHAASGYIAGKIISHHKKLDKYQQLFIVLVVTFSVFPDIDGVFSATVAGHHTILHTPFFWIVACSIIFIIGRKFYPSKNHIITLGIFLGAILHIITDWITARTVGIQWLYPFIATNFDVFPVQPEKGQIPVYEMIMNPYWSFYMENKLLFGFEVGLNFLAVILIIYNINNQKGIT